MIRLEEYSIWSIIILTLLASLIISFGLRIFITILVGREVEIKKKNLFVYTTFYFAGIANFLLLFGREEGMKPSPAATIVR
jgi:hypothetical protein